MTDLTPHTYADEKPKKRAFAASPWMLVIALLFLIFGGLVKFTVPVDVFWFVPAHLTLCGLTIVVFLVRGGLKSLLRVTKERGVQEIAGATFYTVLFVAVIVALNLVARKKELLFFDTTEQQVFTLAPETVELVRDLKAPLTIRGFFLGGKIDNPHLRGILERIERAGKQVTVEYIDPEKRLPLLEEYGISSTNTLHLTYELPDRARTAKIVRRIDEQEIANAIKRLIGGDARTVYYLYGHGEPDLHTRTESKGYTFLRESIEGENLTIKPIVLGQTTTKLPEDAAALVVAAPERPLLPAEKQTIANYIRDGGKAVLISEPKTTQDIAELAQPLGIEVGSNVVVDEVNQIYSAGGLGVQPLVTNYGVHPITEKFDQGVIFATTSSVRAIDSSATGGTLTELAHSSPSSWAETNLSLLFEKAQAAREGDDLHGPVSVAVAFEGPTKPGPFHNSRVVVFGDRDFVSNKDLSQMFNRDLFLNALNWVVGEQLTVTVRSRSLRQAKRGITATEFSQIYLVTGILFPELVLLAGIFVWVRRRRS